MDEINDINESDGCWKIMIDKSDWDGEFYPTHIVGINKTLISVYITKEKAINEEGVYAICVRDNDYHNIDHTKTYILIHSPNATNDQVELFLEMSKGMIETEDNDNLCNRKHVHIISNSTFDDDQKIIN